MRFIERLGLKAPHFHGPGRDRRSAWDTPSPAPSLTPRRHAPELAVEQKRERDFISGTRGKSSFIRKTVYIKNMNNLLVVDAATWTLLQTLSYPGSGASMHGIATSSDDSHVYVTGAGNELYDWTLAANGTATFSRTISLAGGSCPCGIAISADNSKAYVCLSIANKLGVVNLANGTVAQQINVGIAPWDVALSPDGNTAAEARG